MYVILLYYLIWASLGNLHQLVTPLSLYEHHIVTLLSLYGHHMVILLSLYGYLLSGCVQDTSWSKDHEALSRCVSTAPSSVMLTPLYCIPHYLVYMYYKDMHHMERIYLTHSSAFQLRASCHISISNCSELQTVCYPHVDHMEPLHTMHTHTRWCIRESPGQDLCLFRDRGPRILEKGKTISLL